MTDGKFISIYSFILLPFFVPSSFAQLGTSSTGLTVVPILSTPTSNLLPGFQTSHSLPTVFANPTNSFPTDLVDPTQFNNPPTYTDNGGPAAEPDTNSGIVNYYFLLLAIFVFVIIILYLSWTRNRRKRIQRYQDNREHALHRDLDRWGDDHRGWYGYRRGFLRLSRREEGLDERGEAPPPYMPDQPPPAVLPLDSLSPDHRKPPKYAVHSTTGDRPG